MERVQGAVAGLAPGYFALVMASGIISVGMKLKGFDLISTALLIVCIVGFVILLFLMVWRFAAYRGAIIDDLLDPGRAFGFFTFVAGTNVLGVRLGMEGAHVATALLLGLAGTAWLLLGYVVPWTAVLGKVERPVVATANGSWFIWVVASQSVRRDRRGEYRTCIRDRAPRTRGARSDVVVGRGLPVRRHSDDRLAAADALQVRARGAHSAVLGGHGRPRHHRARWRPDRGDGRRAD